MSLNIRELDEQSRRHKEFRAKQASNGSRGGRQKKAWVYLAKTQTGTQLQAKESSSYFVLQSSNCNLNTEDMTPQMVSQAVVLLTGLSGSELIRILDDVAGSEMKAGRDPTEIRDALIAAWLEYFPAQPKMTKFYPRQSLFR